MYRRISLAKKVGIFVATTIHKKKQRTIPLLPEFRKPVDWSRRRVDSCGIRRTGETPQAPAATRRLTAVPAESEAPGTEINSPIPAPIQKKDCK
ncbi:hypothetical protein J7I80_00975 [Bacillus sp. ISL-41]|uniref:hypothetical protein n=1 Tax=Bacillus sp. ISL-41 TaxID=2819127 RepID=UPI001BE7B9B5|nr:hypothetical protein [Bacillus sp. ISL-41]MBT2640795.1 hypothetical protein [Bacillus sp. ISL-41]